MLFDIKSACFRYADGAVGLEDVAGQIATGERVAIVGANGSGKSTLLKALDGLVELTAGTILFEGQAITDATLRDTTFQREFRGRVGFVFQDSDAQLFNATVFEELAFGPAQLGIEKAEVETRVRETMAYLGIGYLADRAPFRLSGGEKKKVAIASVLTMNPDVILLDEPFVALDPRTQAWFLQTLDQLHCAGKTTVIATHSLQSLPDIADRALVLSEDHRLLATVSVGELLRDRDLLRRASLSI